MSYITGNLNNTARVIALNTNYQTLTSSIKSSGSYKLDRFGNTTSLVSASGIVLAISPIGESYGYKNVEFMTEYDLPKIPWTETFTGSNGSYPNTVYWLNTNALEATIYNNKLRATGVSNSSSRLKANVLVWGNFDVQVDLDLPSAPSVNDWNVYLEATFAVRPNYAMDSRFQVRRVYTGNAHGFRCQYQITPNSPQETSTVSSSLTSTKLRIVRNNRTFYGYFWNGTSWTLITSVDFANCTYGGHMPVMFSIGAWSSSSTTITGDFDNFTINSGYVNYLFVEDFFKYSDGSDPESGVFTGKSGLVDVFQKQLRLRVTGTSNDASLMIAQEARGRFDFYSLLTIPTNPSTNNWLTRFQAYIDANNWFSIGRHYTNGTHYIVAESAVGGVYGSTPATSSATTVYLWLYRFNNTANMYYSTNGTSWTLLRNVTNMSAAPARVMFYLSNSVNKPTVDVRYDDIHIVNKYFNDNKVLFPITARIL